MVKPKLESKLHSEFTFFILSVNYAIRVDNPENYDKIKLTKNSIFMEKASCQRVKREKDE
ncbi:hypothetical protein Hs20B_13990 [Lactococcus insecticola]|uniref:Uncharacterized protein n=1 Tax=Pseudolactococcus insecticola TaxID=2709158 RepID=A0A6A0B970_9LACT|nr:hypothetical protein Hs20B_13990 [Lactococcus insecticola]